MKWQILLCFLVVCVVASQAWLRKERDNINSAIGAAGKALLQRGQQRGYSFGSKALGTLFRNKWSKSPRKWGNNKGKKGKSRSKSRSRSRSRSRSGKKCKNNFSFFSFLKLFGLPQAFVGNDDPEDKAVCVEVSQCILLSYGRLTLKDCQDRLVEAGLTPITESVIPGSPVEDQISAVTTDLRACMDRLDGQTSMSGGGK